MIPLWPPEHGRINLFHPKPPTCGHLFHCPWPLSWLPLTTLCVGGGGAPGLVPEVSGSRIWGSGQAWAWASWSLLPPQLCLPQILPFAREEDGCWVPDLWAPGEWELPLSLKMCSVRRGNTPTRNVFPDGEGSPVAVWEPRGPSPRASGSENFCFW